ncbi:LGFP repeat-containing protein [Corynebacterium mastitidis]|uniref:LGFP repeat protein n=2 Tax=Corynebacterium lowii TaxID=1544413 RepID=A0A0Q0YU40_9CORY|nr:hypothetical protein [Corynebacterium mastitidis]KQB85878.1 LGFP repeat protein [Corynebacterium lowii]MDK8451310.1 hypothetical protein [Corynebacterium mastitidis]
MRRRAMAARWGAVALCGALAAGCAAPGESPAPDRTGESAAPATAEDAVGGTPVPSEVARATEQAEEGGAMVLAVTAEESQRYLVEFSDGSSVVYSPETGVQRVRGKLARIWLREGGLGAPVGLPVADEEELPDGSGWTQSFERGSVSWARDAEGQYGAEVQS